MIVSNFEFFFGKKCWFQMFQPGKRVTGRVTEVSRHPLWVKFHLPSGQQATLCATAIASNYDKVEQLITHFKQDCVGFLSICYTTLR